MPTAHSQSGMRPLVLISSLQRRGAERVTVSLLTRLREQGYTVPLCTLTNRHDGPLAAEIEARGVERLDLGSRRLADLAALLRLIGLLRRRRIDVVHAHGQDACILGATACAIEGLSLIVTRHVMEEPTESLRLASRAYLALQALQRADLVVAVSNAVAQRLAQSARLRRPPEVILNGVEPAFFDAASQPDQRQAFRNTLGLRDGPVILSVATLGTGKGHDNLLNAAASLRDRFPHLSVLLAGEGQLEHELRQKAMRLGDTVHLLGHREDIPQLLAAADLVCQASESEALPTALMEAAAAGRPVVATRVGGTAEVVDDQETGLLVPPGNSAALTSAIETLLTDTQRATEMGRTAARVARKRFSLDAYVEATLDVWLRVAGAERIAA